MKEAGCGFSLNSLRRAPERFETGSPILNLRDVPHGGFKIMGNVALKIFTVHVVDSDKPLYEYTD